MPDSYIFQTTNPFGMIISLDTSTFNKHIVSGHPEMMNNISAIKDIIERPKYIIQSDKREDSSIYAGISPHSTFPNMYLKAIVRHTNEKEGMVVTSYFERKFIPNKGGEILYEKNED